MKSQRLDIYLDSDNTIVEGLISASSSPPWVIEFAAQDIPKLVFENKDLFECLIDLRKELAKFNCRPLCNGARLNIYPSSMSREMGGGRVACVLQIGEQAKREDMMDIFAYAEPHLIVLVDEQQEFYHNWNRSLK
jgi:hypothetical protein